MAQVRGHHELANSFALLLLLLLPPSAFETDLHCPWQLANASHNKEEADKLLKELAAVRQQLAEEKQVRQGRV
jgi:hypothetical protein